MEACIEVCEAYPQKCFNDNNDINLTLLQIGLISKGVSLPSLYTLLFN